MKEEDKISRVISILIDETRNELLTWEMEPSTNFRAGIRAVSNIYTTEYNERKLVLYKTRRSNRTINAEQKSNIKLAMMDDNNKPMISFPDTYLLKKLYNTVQTKTSSFTDYLDQIIDNNYKEQA